MPNYSRIAKLGLLLGALALSGVVVASPKTVTLSVPDMNCAACPITVKKALQNVAGVEKVSVTFEPKEAIVTYDDSKTPVDKLRAATTQAGYPSTPKAAN